MNNANFCHSCGRPLEIGAHFCEACGQPVQQQNAPIQPAYYDQQRYEQPAVQPTQAAPQPKSKKNIGAAIIMVLLGLALLLIAVRLPLLSVIGTKTLAEVTDVRQVVDSNSSSMDYNYRINYVFLTDKGESIKSSFEMPKAYDFSKVPAKGKTISIRYLPVWPKLSTPTDYNNSALGTIFMAVLGVGIIILGATGKVSFSRNRYRR